MNHTFSDRNDIAEDVFPSSRTAVDEFNIQHERQTSRSSEKTKVVFKDRKSGVPAHFQRDTNFASQLVFVAKLINARNVGKNGTSIPVARRNIFTGA